MVRWSISRVKRNIVANFVGSGWSALMALIFIPLYVRYMGMEAFGLIGVFAVLQAWLALLDAGMTPTLNREMARHVAGSRSPQSIRDLLRTLEVICLGLGAVVGIGLWAASSFLASDWLRSGALSSEVVARAVSLMAVVVALRFLESIYHSSLLGLQRQVWYNCANAFVATLRHGGAVAILAWVSPDIQSYFLWQVFSSAASVALMATLVQLSLPKAPLAPRFSLRALDDVWKFAGGMFGISFLAVLLTQVDKVLLSRLLTLEAFGYYALAATVSGALYAPVLPITQAAYPRMVELSSREEWPALTSLYHQTAQLVTVATAPLAALLGFFAGGIIFLWSGDASLAERVAPVLSVIALGTFFNGIMNVPGQLQLTFAWTGLGLRINAAAVAILVPTMLVVVPQYGALGAAWIWVVLNAGYVLVATQLMHRRLLPDEMWSWYFADILLPTGAAVAAMFLAKPFEPAGYSDRWHWLAFLLVAGTLALLASTVSARHVRAGALDAIRHALNRQRD